MDWKFVMVMVMGVKFYCRVTTSPGEDFYAHRLVVSTFGLFSERVSLLNCFGQEIRIAKRLFYPIRTMQILNIG